MATSTSFIELKRLGFFKTVTYGLVPQASLNCARTRPAETAITMDVTAPISSSVSPSSLATPR